MIELLRSIVPGGETDEVVRECRNCGTAVEEAVERCSSCGSADIVRYEID